MSNILFKVDSKSLLKALLSISILEKSVSFGTEARNFKTLFGVRCSLFLLRGLSWGMDHFDKCHLIR